MPLPPSVQDRLDRLAPDQRQAATAPPGPVLCVAPAGSGKTTTLVARIAWLVATGIPIDEITAVTFNRRAAVELSERLEQALDWFDSGSAGGSGSSAAPRVRVRTFHALGLEILRSTMQQVPTLLAREAVLREIAPDAGRAELAQLDAAISRLKLDLDVDPADIEADPDAGPVAHAYAHYETTLRQTGAMDFDDLIRLALRALEADAAVLARWRRACGHLLVDETQDVDRSQLRLALLLAAPANRIFLVGDDDQSIYGWRLADVRRVLGLAAQLPDLRRIDLEVNYRCPAAVLQRAVRLVEHNRERFAKTIRPGPRSEGRLILAPQAPDDEARAARVLEHWSGETGSQAVLARTNRELLPAAAVALSRDLAFRAANLELPLEDPQLDGLLSAVRTLTDPGLPLVVRIGRLREAVLAGTVDLPEADGKPHELLAAVLGWAVRFPNLETLHAAIHHARERLAVLRRDDAALTLATAHATKGLEFDHVAVVGLDEGRFPSARSVADAEDPARALEEERRLAYVAWTRARRSLVLVYDPAAPSAFLLEAFTPEELGLDVPGLASANAT